MSDSLPHILFVEKVFLRPPPEPLRGVELFNLQLISELLELGYKLTIPWQEKWRPIVEQRFHASALNPVWMRGRWQPISWALSQGFQRRKFDLLFLANVGNGLIPMMLALRWTGAVRRAVLLAHREAFPRFVRAMEHWTAWIVTVNEQIAKPFRAKKFKRVTVDYGVMAAERYHPATRPAGDPVRFIVLGVLDNAWKGADTAMAAFNRMRPEVRAHCELHLASYMHPPTATEAGIVIHAWKSSEEIPTLLRDMDVMICPSRDEHVMRETFSQAMVQGMLTGLPIIVNDLPILLEKIDAGGGRIFQSVDDLTSVMEELAGDAELRAKLGAESRTTALARYQWSTARFAERYIMDIYRA